MLKIGRCYIYPNQGSDTDWINQYQTTKAWMYSWGYCPNFSKVRVNSMKFKPEVHRSVARGKDKNHHKVGIKYFDNFLDLGAEISS